MNTNKITRFFTLIMLSLLMNSMVQAQNTSAERTINFIKFSVSTDNSRISIDWATDNKGQANYFEIQKSLDGKNFKTIALVLGPDPKQSSCDCYGCFDKYVSKDVKHSYYRLRHVDANGAEQLSEAKSVSQI